jgi:hypothetical protein
MAVAAELDHDAVMINFVCSKCSLMMTAMINAFISQFVEQRVSIRFVLRDESRRRTDGWWSVMMMMTWQVARRSAAHDALAQHSAHHPPQVRHTNPEFVFISHFSLTNDCRVGYLFVGGAQFVEPTNNNNNNNTNKQTHRRRLAREGRARSPTSVATDTIAIMAHRHARARYRIFCRIVVFRFYLTFLFSLFVVDNEYKMFIHSMSTRQTPP